MKPAMKVAINTQMVDKKLEQQGKTMGWLSKEVGQSDNWWSAVRTRGTVTPQKRALIARAIGVAEERLIVKEQQEDTRPQGYDVETISRLEAKVDEALLGIKRCEIQTRTLLRELGVK